MRPGNKTIVGVEQDAPPAAPRTLPAAPRSAWKAVAWFGVIIALIGFGQMLLYLYPDAAFGSPEWEFGAGAQVIGALPFPTMGFAAMLAAALALGSRRGLLSLALLALLVAILILVFLTLFWLVVPMAVRNSPEVAAAAIRQTVARTTLSGVGFLVLYVLSAVFTIRHLRSA